MIALAYSLTGGSFANAGADLVVWGSAAAAIVATAVVLADGPALLGWASVGFILFAAFVPAPPLALLVLLAVAYAPLLPRPRGSLLAGLAVAFILAALIRFASSRLM